MPSYLLLYRGPTSPTGASHEGWPEWFANVGDDLIDIGSPMLNGTSVLAEGGRGEATDLNGYSLVHADSLDAMHKLVESHPFLRASAENAIEIFEIPRKDG